jgi:phospholipid/cholesterol/gamma-HCH transport system permease protein
VRTNRLRDLLLRLSGALSPARRSRTGHTPWRVERVGHVVKFFGQLRTPDALAIAQAVREATAGLQSVEVDLEGVDELDGGVVAILRTEAARRHMEAVVRGGERFRPLLDLYAEVMPSHGTGRTHESVAVHLGRVALEDASALEQIFRFAGEMAVATGRLFRSPRRVHWSEIPLLVEINFLIGFVTGYMSTRALQTFGANVFVADLVSIATTRQLAPLMTAIIVCGRSGAAFTSELGSMKVAEEIDALRILGLDPFGWLVTPRVVALVIVLPVLTLLSDLVGIAGGLVVAVNDLGMTARSYFNEARSALEPWDVESGLWMSIAFALAIGLIACQQGFSASGGPEGVGRRTTASVVAGLFAIVVLDTILTVLYRAFGLS